MTDACFFSLAVRTNTSFPREGKNSSRRISPSPSQRERTRVAPRSGLAWKKFIDVGAGVVDYDYRGNVGVILFNHGEEDFVVRKGDRVAQLIPNASSRRTSSSARIWKTPSAGPVGSGARA